MFLINQCLLFSITLCQIRSKQTKKYAYKRPSKKGREERVDQGRMSPPVGGGGGRGGGGSGGQERGRVDLGGATVRGVERKVNALHLVAK